MSWYIIAWQRATDFSGRSRRKEYWMFQLFNCFVGLFLGALALLVGGDDGLKFFAIGCGVYGLIALVPSLAVTIRRLHDIGKSGWWYFIAFVPIIGGIILFVFTLLDSEPYPNQWGLDPKASERTIAPPYMMPR